jgi:hypothetical protein
MPNLPKDITKAIAATNDVSDWVELQPGDGVRISIPAGITGTVNVESSFDGSTAEGVIAAEDGSTNFAAGYQLTFTAATREYLRVKGTLVTSGSATVKIRRN